MKNSTAKTLAMTGLSFQVVWLIALSACMIGMLGATEPSTSATYTGLSINMAVIGMPLALLALGLMGAALLRSAYRARWFYWSLTVLSGLWLLSFPVGTALGAVLLVLLGKRKTEFYPKQNPPNKPKDDTAE